MSQIQCTKEHNVDKCDQCADSPYLHAFDGLGTVHHQMAERELQNSMNEMDYQLIQLLEYQLPNGKKLVRLDFYKNSNREMN